MFCYITQYMIYKSTEFPMICLHIKLFLHSLSYYKYWSGKTGVELIYLLFYIDNIQCIYLHSMFQIYISTNFISTNITDFDILVQEKFIKICQCTSSFSIIQSRKRGLEHGESPLGIGTWHVKKLDLASLITDAPSKLLTELYVFAHTNGHPLTRRTSKTTIAIYSC